MFQQAHFSHVASTRALCTARARHARAKLRLREQGRRRFRRLGCSTIERAYQRLGKLQRVWSPIVRGRLSAHWLDGDALTRPNEGKLKALLAALGSEIGSEQRKLIAAAFALRFGAVASAAFGPFLIADSLPDVRIENIALKFDAHALLERVAFRTQPSSLSIVETAHERRAVQIAELRAALCGQAEPVLNALYSWSQLKLATLWGLVISAWGNELAKLGSALQCPEHTWDTIAQFFATNHPAFQRRPRFFVVEEHGEVRICHVRACCCLNYRIGDNSYCVSCPVRFHERKIAASGDEAMLSHGLSL